MIGNNGGNITKIHQRHHNFLSFKSQRMKSKRKIRGETDN